MPQHHCLSSAGRILHLRSNDMQKSHCYSSTLAWIAIGVALIFIAPPCDLLTIGSDTHGCCSRL